MEISDQKTRPVLRLSDTSEPDQAIRSSVHAAPANPKLRLVHPSGDIGSSSSPNVSNEASVLTPPQPIRDSSDARWVLAVRTAEQLEGPILPPDRREQLVKLGKVLGLTAFDANLVIAIVQDQARRGYPASHCPTAAEGQLRMIPPAVSRGWVSRVTTGRVGLIATLLLGFVLLEVLLIKLLF
jgi:hypothetical protein